MKADKADEILLNIMFTGDYLKGNNIGHEIINLFKDDKGDNYVYVLQSGTIGYKHNHKIKTILLVRRLNVNLIEILAKAEELTQKTCLYSGNKAHFKDALRVTHDFVTEKNIKYYGVSLNEIFEDNIYKNDLDHDSIPLTFMAEKVIKAKAPIYITTDSALKSRVGYHYIGSIDGIQSFRSQSLKRYVTENTPFAYNVLQDIIADESLWGEETKTLKEEKDFLHDNRKDVHSFMEIIKKEYDELSYSNMLAHFFEDNRKGFVKFAQKVLGIHDVSEDFYIKREYLYVDLWIEDAKNIIIIENKIKSGINGIEKDGFRDAKKSQLSKYYDKARDEANGRTISCFLFAPDYNNISYEKYERGKEYKPVKYSEIYNFFEDNGNMYDASGHTTHFKEFLSALKLHTEQVNNSSIKEMQERFREMYERFVAAIERKKTENSSVNV